MTNSFRINNGDLAESVGELSEKVKTTTSQLAEIITFVTGDNAMQEHSHINKTTLDKFSVDAEGKLIFNNLPVEDKVTKEQLELLKTEVIIARKDFNNKTHDNLSERLNSDMSYVADRFNNASLLDYEGKYISAEKSYDGFTKDLKIKGRTIKNLLGDAGNCENLSKFKHSGQTVIDNSIKLFGNSSFKYTTGYSYIDLLCDQTHKYFISGYCYISSITNATPRIVTWNYGEWSNSSPGVFFDVLKLNQWQRKSAIITGKNNGGMRIQVGNVAGDIVVDYFDGVMVYDLTEIYGAGKEPTDIAQLERELPYVDGTTSVGEESNKIEVLSTGKNLFDINNIILSSGFSREGNIIKLNATADQMECVINIKNLKPGAKYVLSGDIVGDGYMGGNLKNNELGYIWVTSAVKSFNLSLLPTTTSIKIILKNTTGRGMITFTNIQLEEGTVATTYEPYKEDKISILLDEPLRSTPNGTCDEVDLENGKLIQKIKGYTLQANDITALTTTGVNVDYVTIPLTKFAGVSIQKIDIADGSFVISGFNNELSNTLIDSSVNNIYKFKTTDMFLYLIFPKDAYTNLSTAQASLAGTKIVYELAAPIEKPLDLPNVLRTYDNKTHIFTQESLIEPTVQTKIPSNVNAIVSTLKLENEELTKSLEERSIMNIENSLDQDLRITKIELGVM